MESISKESKDYREDYSLVGIVEDIKDKRISR